jgi:FKBP-type peptidyl-prolyl cis-trans isomerase
MSRTLTVAVLTTLALSTGALAACGSDSSPTASTDSSGSGTSSDSAAECNRGSAVPTDTATDSTDADGSVAAPSTTLADKPAVEVPAETPAELVVTVLTPGDGAGAVAGDTVVVDYVGVTTAAGVEFDNSYDRGEPFPVSLGSGGVIPGWEQGLLGAQAGSQIQLDIPAALAYGEAGSGDIGPNEALTFVIDVRAIILAADPAGEPTEPGVPASDCATEVSTTDLKDGEGVAVEAGQTAYVHVVLFRGDNLVALQSTWSGSCEPNCQPVPVPLTEGTFPGLLEGLEGMKVGGRRAIVIPPDKGFGPEGDPTIGLPAGADIIMVVDLLGAY